MMSQDFGYFPQRGLQNGGRPVAVVMWRMICVCLTNLSSHYRRRIPGLYPKLKQPWDSQWGIVWLSFVCHLILRLKYEVKMKTSELGLLQIDRFSTRYFLKYYKLHTKYWIEKMWVYFTENADIMKAFFTSHHVGLFALVWSEAIVVWGNSCTNMIRRHCCVSGHFCVNVIPEHCFPTMPSINDLCMVNNAIRVPIITQ
jgi:hypothetical protein